MRKWNKKNYTEYCSKLHEFKYDYSLITDEILEKQTKIPIICLKCGNVYYKNKKDHLKGYPACQKCYSRRKIYNKLSLNEVINKSKNVHKNKYDYSMIESFGYVNTHQKVPIICNIHGVFYQSMKNHINRRMGCPECAKINRHLNNRKGISFYMKKIIEFHKDLYDYSLVDFQKSYTLDDKIPIICKKHGIFYQSLKSHSYGQGCPSCHNNKMENIFESMLKKLNINFNKQKTFPDLYGNTNKLKFDFYIKKLNMCIELDGKQHFEFIKEIQKTYDNFLLGKKYDKKKNDYCKKNGIQLIRINYKEFKTRVIDIINLIKERYFKI